jgi:hypothetical protein
VPARGQDCKARIFLSIAEMPIFAAISPLGAIWHASCQRNCTTIQEPARYEEVLSNEQRGPAQKDLPGFFSAKALTATVRRLFCFRSILGRQAKGGGYGKFM